MAKAPAVGEAAPDFTLTGIHLVEGEARGEEYTLSAQRGRPVVLAFYPADDTTVCTRQLCAYSSGLERFEELDATVWGISPQDVVSHEKFAKTHGLRIPLLADPSRAVAEAYGVSAPLLGLRRAIFLVGPTGVIRWRHVSLVGMTFQPVDALVAQLATIKARD